MAKTNISWTDESWNPVTGCDKISLGCKNCYAEKMAKRLQLMGQQNYQDGFKVTLHPHMLFRPFSWRKPRHVFVNSMSDVFHKDVPDIYVQTVFGAMNAAKWHQFQALTKRSSRLAQLAPQLCWSDNIWQGVTVESHQYIHRIDNLRTVPAHIRFLSLEPLLSPMPNLNLDGIHWVIVGGESGSGWRPMDADWVRDIRDQCLAANIPFFFKQWAGYSKQKSGNVLDGRTWTQKPVV